MMKREEIYKKLAEYKRVLEEKGYNVIYIGLYGSQNYNVDDEHSDIDAKAIILPSLHDVIFRRVTSRVVELESGAIDVKDLITYYDVIRKGNFSYIEAMDTEYFIGDKYIKELFKQIRPNLKSILGAMHEKKKALTHEYPSKHGEFEKWGFDPKQYHHIIRLHDMLQHINKTGDFVSYLKYDAGYMANHMISLKRNSYDYSKEYVEKWSEAYIDASKALIPEDYVYEPADLQEEINKYIEDKLKIELLKDNEVVSAREIRTFDNGIPKKDLEKFPVLAQYDGQDISYIVYESIEIL